MRLATYRDGTRDGRLVVVRRDAQTAAPVERWPTLQRALDQWDEAEPDLRATAHALDSGQTPGYALDPAQLGAPLPRAYEFVDGSAYLNHIVLVRRARGAEPPPLMEKEPLVYQGGSGDLLGPRDPFVLRTPQLGLDFEAEVAVILGDVPIGTAAQDAARYVRLVTLINDWTLRNLVGHELNKGFGFFQSKPATSFAPFAVTPDGLGDAWHDARLHARVQTHLDGHLVGDVDAGPEMFFSFGALIQHIATTRRFVAGTIVGSGTVSNADRSRGISCLAERRMIETIEQGSPTTPFLAIGSTVRIEAVLGDGSSPFGAIEAQVVAP